MAMTCPKCGYARTPKETVSEAQCPACGIFYAKIAQPVSPALRST